MGQVWKWSFCHPALVSAWAEGRTHEEDGRSFVGSWSFLPLRTKPGQITALYLDLRGWLNFREQSMLCRSHALLLSPFTWSPPPGTRSSMGEEAQVLPRLSLL